jgi:serine/threonine protein kinase
MASPTGSVTTVERFLKALERSGLLPPDAVRAALAAAPPAARADPQQLADHLVRLGKLSHFQARKILAGTPGGLVLGGYQVVMPIGRGGMGTVYLARDTTHHRLVALKILPPHRAKAEERLLTRFRREMELSRRVTHPNMARVYEVGEAQGIHYIAMEYIAGQSLYRVVSQNGPLPVGRAAKLFAQATAALQHAHDQGLIHRDLKPSNLMIAPGDQVKVLDLGLALIEGEVVDDPTVVGGQGYVVGTMDYIAPEQTEDATGVGPRADVYGLGCTLYFALTGRPPFPGGDTRSKIQRHRTAIPPPVQELNPLIPADFTALVHAMLAKRPEDRPPSAADVRRQLLPWADALAPTPLLPAAPAATPPEDNDTADVIAELEAREPTDGADGDGPDWEWVPAATSAEEIDRLTGESRWSAWLPLLIVAAAALIALTLILLAWLAAG